MLPYLQLLTTLQLLKTLLTTLQFIFFLNVKIFVFYFKRYLHSKCLCTGAYNWKTGLKETFQIRKNIVFLFKFACFSPIVSIQGPIVLGEGSILMLLFGVIALTLFVLVGACVYRGWLMADQRKHAEPSLFHPAPFNHVRYTQGLSSSDAPGLKD